MQLFVTYTFCVLMLYCSAYRPLDWRPVGGSSADASRPSDHTEVSVYPSSL